MKFFVFLLLVTLINLYVINGQTVCRKWKDDKTTDLKKVLGHWYTHLGDKHLVKKNEMCSEYTFTWNNSTQSVNLENTQHSNDNTSKTIKGRAHKTPFPGVFDVAYENGLVLVINIVALDDNYILFAGCFRDNVFIRIVTKDKTPSDEVKKIIEDKIAENAIDRSELINFCSDA